MREKIQRIEQLELSKSIYKKIAGVSCANNAPMIFAIVNGYATVFDGCCNSWTCPRCGVIRATQEYGRMVHGAKKLADDGYDLYFWTLTCRGREMPLATAERDYYRWTTKLLNAARKQCQRSGGFWCYVQVTERQKRKHPHSHLITTFTPTDTVERNVHRNGKIEIRLKSDWFTKQNIKSGLGEQCDITKVRSAHGVASYIAKYLFKDAMTTDFPKGWRRIRYSRSFPKSPAREDIDLAFPILSRDDWYRIKNLQVRVHTSSTRAYIVAKEYGLQNLLIDSTSEGRGQS